MKPNMNYAKLQDSYLFYNIGQRVAAYSAAHPEQHLYRMGIGDVSRPLCPAVIEALHRAVDDQADFDRFRGYMPECGDDFLRLAVADHYAARGVNVSPEEVFISDGASGTLGSIIDLFSADSRVLVVEPTYPAYVDANVMSGRRLLHLPSGREDSFAPGPERAPECDVVYICSPNNPTGAVFSREKLEAWIGWANRTGAVILFDAAYEAFIAEPDLPRSIFEVPGARTCAIEICSLSKTAGFTGTRCGYTVIPDELTRCGLSLRKMWVRNRTTKTNGVSYIIQRGAEAVFTPEGQRQIREDLDVYRTNAARFLEALEATGLWFCGGKNAPYIWLQCPEGVGSWEFFDLLLERCQIVGTPGAGFGECGEGFFRFSMFGDPDDTAEAASRLRALLG